MPVRRQSDKAKARAKHWREIVRPAVLERDNHRCVMCGQAGTWDSLDVHHALVPKRQGGPDELWNCLALHRKCHEEAHRYSSKWRQWFREYLSSQ